MSNDENDPRDLAGGNAPSKPHLDVPGADEWIDLPAPLHYGGSEDIELRASGADIPRLPSEEAIDAAVREVLVLLADQPGDASGDFVAWASKEIRLSSGLGADPMAVARNLIQGFLEGKRRSRASRIASTPSLIGEDAYLDLLRRILADGERRSDRTGTGTLSIFGAQLRFDLRDGFPLLTTKKVNFPAIVRELLWFLRGSTNIFDGLTQHTQIWDEWAGPDGDLGPIYGFQWRRWGADHKTIQEHRRKARLWEGMTQDQRDAVDAWHPDPVHPDAERDLRLTRGIDQISQAIEQVKTNPDSRRIIVSAWNVADVPQMRLPPCHLLFQLNVVGGHLDCQLYQRSADMALGVPFNIASYALLTSMIARECGLVARHFVHTFGDAHVYLNHVDGVREQVERVPMRSPRLVLADKPVLAQTFEDVSIEGYVHHPAIKFQVSV